MLSSILIGLFFAFFLAMGFVLIYGTQHRWAMVTDPPDGMWICYSQSLIKKVFGQRFLIVYSYSMGTVFVAAGLFGLITIFWH